MKLWKVGVLLAAGVALAGCSSKITMVRFNVEADNGGKAALGFEANGSTLTTETAQRSSGELAAATEGAQAALGAIRDAMAEYKPDLSKKDSENQTTTTTTNTTNYKDNEDNTVKDEDVKEEVDIGVEEVSDDLEYKNKATFKSYGVRNGRQAWRIQGKGPSFGEPIKFVFSSGKTFTVKDTSKNCRDDENTCARSSSADMYGFVFKPGIGPNGEGDSNTGTSHGGIYLHAPWKDTSGSVTLYYNKP